MNARDLLHPDGHHRQHWSEHGKSDDPKQHDDEQSPLSVGQLRYAESLCYGQIAVHGHGRYCEHAGRHGDA